MGTEFSDWLSKHLNANDRDIEIILKDELATKFFITWSIFEARCYNGFAKVSMIKKFVEDIESNIPQSTIEVDTKYFHNRYQDKNNYRHLIYDKNNDDPTFKGITEKEYATLSLYEKLYLLSFVIYRYRNNIFHGNKRIESWLKFRNEIQKCITIMQLFLDTKAK
jgi:hypothetical protein